MRDTYLNFMMEEGLPQTSKNTGWGNSRLTKHNSLVLYLLIIVSLPQKQLLTHFCLYYLRCNPLFCRNVESVQVAKV